MGRHSYKHSLTAVGESRSSIGDGYVDEAITAINRTAAATVATMTSYDLGVDQTLPMLFDDGVLERASAAKGLINPASTIAAYNIGDKVSLTLSFEKSRYPTLMPAAMRINPDRVGPLTAYVEAVRAIYDKFEEVKAVLRWMNRNATPGAIRYYWPTALALCPNSPAMREVAGSVPTRFTVPPKIHDYLDIIKTSAATMTSAAMLPSTAQPRVRTTMFLTFASSSVVGLRYRTDSISFNI